MSGHTKEPWAVDLDGHHLNCVYVVDSDGNVAIARVTDYKLMGVAEANARRIVACVNACEGISTEQLETWWAMSRPVLQSLKELKGEADREARQRDQLLVALKGLLDTLAMPSDTTHPAIRAARAAIDAVESAR